jgi:hypothetical protein
MAFYAPLRSRRARFRSSRASLGFAAPNGIRERAFQGVFSKHARHGDKNMPAKLGIKHNRTCLQQIRDVSGGPRW